jgi:YegS/Rv2252/BmrU family lipid kinase
MSAARRLCVLCNPTAGGGRSLQALAPVQRALEERGLELRVGRTESGDHAAELARGAAEAGEEVVAFGGDGMVRIAAHAVRGTDAVLGVLPGGRGNDFARSLGIPRDPVAACEIVADGELRTVDAGDVDGETFVGVASIGLESEVTRIANAAPRLGGRTVYTGATIVGLARWRPATYELDLDGERHSYTGFMAAVANSGRFGGGMRIAPHARLDDGLLDVVVIEHGSRLRFLLNVPKVFRGTHVADHHVHVLRAREVGLRADRQFEVYADGDEIAATPAVARAVPGALRVRAPKPTN